MAKKKNKKQTFSAQTNSSNTADRPDTTDKKNRVVDKLERANLEARENAVKPSSAIDRMLWIAGLGLVCLFYLLLKLYSLNLYGGDEFIYLYQGKLVSEGAIPYSEFAMAHPPMQAIFTAFVFKIFGVNFTVMRLLPFLWCLTGGLALAVMVHRELGKIASVFAAALFLLAHEPLRASSHYTGINMTVALLIFTFLAYRAKYIRTAAALAVVSVFARLYAIPGVVALCLFALAVNFKEGRRLIVFGAIFGSIAFLALGLWTGFGDMVHNIFLYHTDKTPMTDNSLVGMRNSVFYHNATQASLFALSLPALFAAISGEFKKLNTKISVLFRLRTIITSDNLGLPILCVFTGILFLGLLLNMDRVWMYYFIPAFPFAAVSSAWMISRFVHFVVQMIQAKGNLAIAGMSKATAIGKLGLLTLFVISYILSPNLEKQLTYYKKEIQKPINERTHKYTFAPTALPDFINNMVREYLWQDDRVIGNSYGTISHYMWHESRIFEEAEEIVKIIKKETSPTGELFGDSGSVPMFALLSDRRIAGNEVDTNIQRYRSKNADPKELISKIDNYKTEMIILRRRFGVWGVDEVRKLVETKYRRLTEIQTNQGWVFDIYKRKSDLSESKES